jgi:DHA2 family multidrug resistance protein
MTVTLATFMELLDTSIANVSLPYIAGGLGRSFDEVTWILTTYLVANAVVLPMSAWLSRVFGRKNYYLGCVALFTISSFCCGIAPSLGFMLLSRVFQGIGGGGLAPVEQAILVDTFPPEKRASAFALYTIAIVTAPAIGPVLGGWITDNYSWRWVFFINIPIGILSLYLSSRLVQDPAAFTAERKSARAGGRLKIDTTGIVLIGLGSAALEIFLDRGQIDDWFGSRLIASAFGIAIVCWTGAIIWELRQKDPVIDLRLFKSRHFTIAAVLLFVFGFGIFGTTTMIPQILQSLYGYRAIDAGLVLGPGALMITLLAPVGARLVQKGVIHPRVMLGFSLAGAAAAIWYYSTFNLATNYGHYALARVFQGLAYAFFFVPLNIVAYSELRPDQNNRASSLTNLFRNWGGSFGIAFIATASERRYDYHQATVAATLPQTSALLEQRVRSLTGFLNQRGISIGDAHAAAVANVYRDLGNQAHLLAFMDCFRVIALVTLVAAPLTFFIRRFRAGGAPGGH